MYQPKPIIIKDVQLTEDILELSEVLAKNVHEIWATQRIEDGWSYGPERNDLLKTHPNLVPYEELEEIDKNYDRKTALGTLQTIMTLGFRIEKEQ